MVLTTTTLDRTVDGSSNGTVLGTSAVSARGCAMAAYQQLADHRITAGLCASSFGGRVWLRPTTLDVIAPTTPGHLAWSPPT
jgi:hypothetical protein